MNAYKLDPLQSTRPSRAPRSEDSEDPLERGRRPIVYLAEDDNELRTVLREALTRAGFEVFSATNGHEMLRLLTAASCDEVPRPDVLVMDIRMPRSSGIDVLGAIRLAEWTQPVVLMTGFGDPAAYEMAASWGASVILDKPFDVDELVSVLDVLLRLSHADVLRSRPTNDSESDALNDDP